MHPYYNNWQNQNNHDLEEEKPAEQQLEDQDARGGADESSRAEPSFASELLEEQEKGQPANTGPDENACKKEMEELRLRTAAEMDNFKKRLTREHQEQMRYAAEKVLNDILPAIDNLDLALQYGSKHEACKDMMQGISMTRKLLLEAVQKHGLSPVGEIGEAFNPAVHEAIGFEANPELAQGAVSRILQNGYKLNDRLLRPAKVMVNN